MDQVWILFDRECKYSTAPRIVSKTTKKHSNLETFMKSHAFDNITKMSYSKKQDKSYTTNCIFWNNKANFHWIHKWALLGCTNTQSIIEIHNCLVCPIVLNIFVKCQQLSDKSESYRYMVTDYFLRNLPATSILWFQQYWTGPLANRTSTNWLHVHFPWKLISHWCRALEEEIDLLFASARRHLQYYFLYIRNQFLRETWK